MDLVEIRSGYTFRSAIDSFSDGDVEVIQSGDLGVQFNFTLRQKIDFPGNDEHLLQYGDILLSARGFSKAMVYRENKKAVASSSLFVLRVKSNKTSPSFISMFFNSEFGMKEVFRLSSNTSVQTITKENLGQIKIPEIPPDKQDHLGNLIQTIDDYKSLIQEKEIYLNSIRSNIINKTLKEIAR